MSVFKNLLTWARKEDGIFLDEYIPKLEDIKKMSWVQDPFPYIVIDNIFTEEYANELETYINTLLQEKPLQEARASDTFSRIADYDAYSRSLLPDLSGPLRVFYSREWYELFKNLSGFQLDENILTTIHHHKIGSETGWVHSDYGKYSFREAPIANGLNHWRQNSLYQGGGRNGKLNDIENQEGVIFTRRSLSFLYYVGKNGWQEGDGGETAFFLSKDGGVPVKKIAPIHNRLFVFQVSPRSHHAFQSNVKNVRNSVVQWFHEPIEVMDARLHLKK